MASNNTVKITFVGKDALTPVMAGINNSVTNFKQNAATGFGLAAGMRFQTLAIEAMGKVKDIMVQSVQDASNLEQAYGKLDAVLRGHTQSMVAFGKISASSLGLSRRQVYEYGAGIANLIQVTGIGAEESGKMAEALVRLAGDVAAFNNRDVQEVLVAFNAGLVGEAEPARRLGVLISQLAVETYLLEHGFVRSKAEITDSMKVMARYNIILEDTRRQQGQFARESDNFMTKQMKLKATYENLSATLGTYVIQAITPLMDRLVKLAEIGDKLGQAFQDLTGSMGAFGDMLKQVVDAIMTALNPAGLLLMIIDKAHEIIVGTTTDTFDFGDALITAGEAATAAGAGLNNASEALKAFQSLQSPEDYTKFSPKKIFKDLKEQIKEYRKEVNWLNNHPNFMDKLFKSYAKLVTSPAFKKLQEVAKQLGETSPQYGLVSNIIGFGTQQFGSLDPGTGEDPRWIRVGRMLGLRLSKGFQNAISNSKMGTTMLVTMQTQIDSNKPLKVPFVLSSATTGRRGNAGSFTGSGTYAGPTYPGGRGYRPGAQPETVDSGGGGAFGGRASPYKTYLVGERGPEWLTMGAQSGYISSNAGGGDITVNIDGEKIFKIVNRRMGRAVAMGV